MLSFFRRQKTADSDKTGKGDKDKKEAKRKEKQGTLPPSPTAAKRDVSAPARATQVEVEERRSRSGDGQPVGVVTIQDTQPAIVNRTTATTAVFTPPVSLNSPAQATVEAVKVVESRPEVVGNSQALPVTTKAVETQPSVLSSPTTMAKAVETHPASSSPSAVTKPPLLGSPAGMTKAVGTDSAPIGTTTLSVSKKPAAMPPPPALSGPTPASLSPVRPSSASTPTPDVTGLYTTTTTTPTTTQRTLFATLITPALRPKQEPTQSKPLQQTNQEADDAKKTGSGELDKRTLVNQETKFQEQLAALTAQLSERDTEANKLTYRMEELRRDVEVKTGGMDRLQAELLAAHKESECVRQKLRKMEDDVTVYRQKNQELSEELLKKVDEVTAAENRHKERIAQLETSIMDLQTAMKKLEKDLEEIRLERDRLEEDKAEMEAEREEEMNIVQEALEESQQEKDLIQARFERDFERLRTVNTDREQQLLNDFEWKLREVEQACKRRLEEKDKKADEKISKYQKEIADKIKEADEQLKEAQKLKSFEAEATQLRGVMHEQQRTIRSAQRQTEQLQVNERMLKEEVTRLRTAVDTEKNMSQNLQNINEKKLSDMERKLHTHLEEQKSEMDQKWEERLRHECYRLKTELEQLHIEEKQSALNSLRSEKDREIKAARQNLEQQLQESLNKVSVLTDSLNEKETIYQKELDRIQANSDRDILDIRRKLDKMDMSYQDQIEKLKERHEQEIEQLNWESSRKIQQLEQNWQIQNSSTRTTLELVKEQMERDTQDKLEALETKHQEKIEKQWERLTQEKEAEINEVQEKHQKDLHNIMDEFQQKMKHNSSREEELIKKILILESKLQGQCTMIGDLQGNADLLHGSVQVLNEQILGQSKEIQRAQTQAAQKIRERELELAAEWESKLAAITEECNKRMKQCQQQHTIVQQELMQKIDSLSRLLEEAHFEQNNRQSLPEDIQRINDLTTTLTKRDQELESLAEEKRFYQMELVNRETTYNQIFGSQPVVGVMDPLQYTNGPKKKGGGRGKGAVASQHEPTPPCIGPKPPRKHKKGGGGGGGAAATPAQVARSKSLDFKHPPKSPSKQKSTNTATVPESPDESFTISTL